MQKKPTISLRKKVLPALIAALMMTIFIGLALTAFGLNALLNQKVSVAQAQTQSDPQILSDQATLQDLQASIAQYQAREAQYQSELQKAADGRPDECS